MKFNPMNKNKNKAISKIFPAKLVHELNLK